MQGQLPQDRRVGEALASAQTLEVQWALGNEGVTEDHVKAAWKQYTAEIERSMKERAQAQAAGIVQSWTQAEAAAAAAPVLEPFPQLTQISGIKVQIWELKHLPKMDTLGSCDPFVELEAGGKKVTTSIKKGTYNAVYGEEFFMEVDTARPGDLKLTVYDWDRIGSNDLVGEVIVILGDGSDARHNYLAPAQQKVYQVLDKKGAPVRGQDKQVTELTVTITPMYETAVAGADALSLVGGAPGRVGSDGKGHGLGSGDASVFLMVTLASGSNLPVMDSALAGGLSDPYCKVEVLYNQAPSSGHVTVGVKQEFSTSIQRNTLNPLWNESMLLGPFNAKHTGAYLHINLFDEDRVGKDEFMGSIRPVVLRQLLQMPAPEDKGIKQVLKGNVEVWDKAGRMRMGPKKGGEPEKPSKLVMSVHSVRTDLVMAAIVPPNSLDPTKCKELKQRLKQYSWKLVIDGLRLDNLNLEQETDVEVHVRLASESKTASRDVESRALRTRMEEYGGSGLWRGNFGFTDNPFQEIPFSGSSTNRSQQKLLITINTKASLFSPSKQLGKAEVGMLDLAAAILHPQASSSSEISCNVTLVDSKEKARDKWGFFSRLRIRARVTYLDPRIRDTDDENKEWKLESPDQILKYAEVLNDQMKKFHKSDEIAQQWLQHRDGELARLHEEYARLHSAVELSGDWDVGREHLLQMRLRELHTGMAAVQGRYPSGQSAIIMGLAITLIHVLLYHLFIL